MRVLLTKCLKKSYLCQIVMKKKEVMFIPVELMYAEQFENDTAFASGILIDKNMTIVCVVGDLDSDNVGFETIACEALKDIPVRMISYGGSNHNISFLVKAEDKKRTLQALSKTLFNS